MTLLSCPKCSKAFSKPSHLQRHAQSHSHDRAFGCELCGKRFTREDSKARHIRRLHKTDNVIFSSAERSSHTAADTATRATPSQSSDIEETEGVSSQLHPGTGTTPSYAAHQNSVADPLDRPYKALDEDAARLLVAQENEGENDTLSGIHQTILQANPTTFGAIYDASMSGMLALDSAAQVMNAADGESADYGISSHGDGAINGAFGLEGQQNQLWQDAPTWEAALESDTFFDSWLQYDPSNSLAGSASKPFALFSDLSQSQRDLSACTQSFPQQPNTMYTTAQMRQDISAPAVPASPRTTTFWSQWLQAESAHTSPNFAEAQSERMANAPTDVLSGLKSLVGSPAAFNPNDAGHGKATPIAAHTTDSEATSSSLHVIAAQGEEILPEDQWHTIAGESAPISFSPEGQSSTLSTLWTIDGQAWEVIRDRLRTSIQLSDMLEDDPDCASMIPGMSIGFIKSCLHLYFARFHPQFPVIHEPTFSPNYSPAYLCLMVVAIGSTFIGTGPTSKLGQWIYRRVHRLMVNNRERRLASSSSRVEFALAGVLGQTFSLLHGAPAELLTAESFHGGVCNLVRRSGIMVSAGVAAPIHLADVSISEEVLSQAWQKWGLLESLHRTSIALAIHAAELYQFSSVPGLLLRRIARDSSDNERLFAAPTASAWQGILRNMSTAGGNTISRENPRAELDIFHIHALLGQVLIDIHNSREMQQGCLLLRSQYETPTQFYELMIGLSNECGISPRDNVSRPTDNRYTTFRALWHYCYVDFWSSSGDIEAAVGRYGTNIIARQALGRLRTWVNTPPARLAALHAICVLEEAAGLSDVNFLIPRAIYRSTLLLFCILSLADSQLSEPGRSVKINGAVDWLSLADLCSKLNSSNAHSAVVGHAQTSTNGLERYIISGGAIIARPFLSGHDRHTDIVSLLAGSMRLLTTSTQWGLGEVLAGLLAQISINAQS